jgi:hypothetical protein
VMTIRLSTDRIVITVGDDADVGQAARPPRWRSSICARDAADVCRQRGAPPGYGTMQDSNPDCSSTSSAIRSTSATLDQMTL